MLTFNEYLQEAESAIDTLDKLSNLTDDEIIRLWNKVCEDENKIYRLDDFIDTLTDEEIELVSSPKYRYRFNHNDEYGMIDLQGHPVSFSGEDVLDYIDGMKVAKIL